MISNEFQEKKYTYLLDCTNLGMNMCRNLLENEFKSSLLILLNHFQQV